MWISLKVKLDQLQILVGQGRTCGDYHHFQPRRKLLPESRLGKQEVSVAELVQ